MMLTVLPEEYALEGEVKGEGRVYKNSRCGETADHMTMVTCPCMKQSL